MRRISLTQQARLDLLEIWNDLAEDDYAFAMRFNIQVDEDLLRLAEFPGIGHGRDDLVKDPLRLWRVMSWYIVYRHDKDLLSILRVVHTGRDLRKLLKNLH